MRPKIQGGMGFRRMEDFNWALIAKQVWRLVRFSYSLASRLLKGLYFKHGDVLEAGLGSNPSYIWRSIFWNKGILGRGLFWKDGSCDVDLISNTFNPWIAGEILKIPLSSRLCFDTRFWRFDEKGKYSVRNGYRLQQGLFAQPEHQSALLLQSWWTFLWGLSIPPKVEFEKFAIQTWEIWKERQNLIHDDSRTSMANVSWSLTFLTDFQKAKALDQPVVPAHSVLDDRRWMAPDAGTFKLNVEACVNNNSSQYSIAGVLRDCQGRLLIAFGKQISQPLSVSRGELLAIREEIKLVYEKNFLDVLVVSDSVLAVQAVNTVQDDLGYVGTCASVINILVQAPFISGIVYEPRLSNIVAHNLAKFSLLSHSPFVWLNSDFPYWLVEFVMNDLS
ncbi:uncharacterized protein [Primulina eburnea]|uniref:uncharacterized protein n=1 Tax=Primulina eburnea TaxID=1245227 RepID=UPI003C6C6484